MATPAPARAILRLDKDFSAPENESLHMSVFVLAKRGGKAVLVQAKDYTGETAWMLPASFLHYGEPPAIAAARVARERLGVPRPTGLKLAAIETFSEGHDGSGEHWDMCFVYAMPGPAKPKPGPTASAVAYFGARDAPWDELGNEHADILARVWKRPKARKAR